MWQASFSPFVDRVGPLADEVLRPLAHLPKRPVTLAGFGTQALLPASWSWRRFRTPQARALFAGIAAHAFTPLHLPASSAAGTLLTVAGHAHGWPVAVGGSQAIADALAAELRSFGGEIVTDSPVTGFPQVNDADTVLLDTSLEVAAAILGDSFRTGWRVPGRFRRGPAVAKVDYVLEGDVPWSHQDARRAGTVQLAAPPNRSPMPSRTVGQDAYRSVPSPWSASSTADPSRSRVIDGRTLNPLWAYAHVPAGWTGSEQETFNLVTAQIERAAPGFRSASWTGGPLPAAVASTTSQRRRGDLRRCQRPGATHRATPRPAAL